MPLAEVDLENVIKTAYLKHSLILTASLKIMSTTFLFQI